MPAHIKSGSTSIGRGYLEAGQFDADNWTQDNSTRATIGRKNYLTAPENTPQFANISLESEKAGNTCRNRKIFVHKYIDPEKSVIMPDLGSEPRELWL